MSYLNRVMSLLEAKNESLTNLILVSSNADIELSDCLAMSPERMVVSIADHNQVPQLKAKVANVSGVICIEELLVNEDFDSRLNLYNVDSFNSCVDITSSTNEFSKLQVLNNCDREFINLAEFNQRHLLNIKGRGDVNVLVCEVLISTKIYSDESLLKPLKKFKYIWFTMLPSQVTELNQSVMYENGFILSQIDDFDGLTKLLFIRSDEFYQLEALNADLELDIIELTSDLSKLQAKEKKAELDLISLRLKYRDLLLSHRGIN